MGALFVLCGILAGLAVYRSGEARARWQSLKAAKTTARNQRNTAWRHTRSAALYVAGVIFLLVIVLKLLSRPCSATSGACGLPAWKIGVVASMPCSGDANQAERRSTDRECPPSLARLRRMWPVRGPVEPHDPLLRSSLYARA